MEEAEELTLPQLVAIVVNMKEQSRRNENKAMELERRIAELEREVRQRRGR